MLHHRRQAEHQKAQMLDRARKAAAARDLSVFIDRIREEVYTYAYTSFEKAFGEDNDEGSFLAFIHRGVTQSLKDLDNRWIKAVHSNHNVVPARAFRVLDPKTGITDITPLDQALALQIRNDIVDLIVQYAEDYGKIPIDRLMTWANGLIVETAMEPKALIEGAASRKSRK